MNNINDQKKVQTFIYGLFFSLCSLPVYAAAPIQNPFYTTPAWKLWYEDAAPVTGVTVPLVSNILFPDDADAVTNPGRFLAYRKGTDWPQRKYAGFWYDVYSSHDSNASCASPHSYIRSSWTGDFGNTVTLRASSYADHSKDAHMHRWDYYGCVGGPINGNTVGVLWTSQSTTGMGHDRTTTFYNIDDLERVNYFTNVLKAGPSHDSYNDNDLLYSTDKYDALVPVYYNSNGSSGSEEIALAKLLITGGYLPRTVKPELLRNGLYQSAMLYMWKAALPYDVPYDHELRQRVAYVSDGDGTKIGHLSGHRTQIGRQANFYDPTQHLANMVALAKDMTVVPPIALLKKVSITGVTEQSVNKSAIRAWQQAGETAQITVSVGDSFDLQGLPLTYRWKVLNGNKNTSVQQVSGTDYLITVPADSTLPQGRTVIMLVANNGFYDSNPATINVMRKSGATYNLRLPPVTGIDNRAILPGESVSFSMQSRDYEGFPVTFSKWTGMGDLDGNVFNWNTSAVTAPGSYPVHVAASDGTTGGGYNGGEATVTVSNAVADIAADSVVGHAPLTVNFSSAGSRALGGGALSYLWNFDDGTTSTSPNPSHIFTQPGFHDVALTVTGSLGSHTARKVVEVRNAWPLAINNGWSLATGVDPTVWSATGATVNTANSLGVHLQISGGATGVPVGITSVQSFTLPVYIESVFRRPSTTAALSNGFKFFGSQLGNPKGVTNSYFQQNDMSIGHPTVSNPSVWTTQFIGPHLWYPRVLSELKIYIENDPNNPGKIRYRGYVDADRGRYFIKYDNQNPAESWYNTVLGFTSEEAGNSDILRYQAWTPTGAITGPEINVEGERGQNVYNRLLGLSETYKDTIPVDDSTEFRQPATVGGSVTRVYTVRNQGTTNLTLSSVSITGANAADYVVSSAPAATVVPGGTTSFGVTFTPSAAGLRLATINIASNDTDESTLSFNVRGWQRTAREINVEGNALNIVSGDSTPNAADHTDFGSVVSGTSLERTYLIQNRGLDALSLTGVSISGTEAGDYVVSTAPRTTLQGLESTALKIRFTPSAMGMRAATVTISSNDADESNYTFALQGAGVNSVIVDQSRINVAEGSTASFNVKLAQAPTAPVTVTVSMVTAGHMDKNVTVQSAATLLFNASNWSTNQTVTVADVENDADAISGNALVRLNADSADVQPGYVRVAEIDNDLYNRPLAYDLSASVDEDCSVAITLKGSDEDVGSNLVFSILSAPLNGTLTGTVPNLTYKGFQDYNGLDSFTFKVNDGLTDSAGATVSVTVNPIDDALDTDGDGLKDGDEKCVYGTNPLLADSDYDGLSDYVEIFTYQTNPKANGGYDTDLDGMNDGWEVAHINAVNPLLADANLDFDNDGLSNQMEYSYGADPANPDSDGDGLNDGVEVNTYSTSPQSSDTDFDHLSDGDEVNIYFTDPNSWVDTDLDGLPDDWETVNGYNINNEADGQLDTDGDGVINYLEYWRDTDSRSTASVPTFKTIYVDGPGCDANGTPDGTMANPYCGIDDGVYYAEGGDTVQVAGGDYSSTSSAVSVPINLTAAPGQQVIYSGVYGFSSFTVSDIAWGKVSGITFSFGYGVKLSNARNVFFENNVVTGGAYSNALTINLGSKVTAKNIVVIGNPAYTGIQMGGTGTVVDFQNITVTGSSLGINFGPILPTVTIRNAIVYGNTTDFGATVPSSIISYSLVGNAAFAGSNGNIMADPLFVNPTAADYRVQTGSPAIDAGNPADAYGNEPQPNGCRINMGAEGNTAQATLSSDTDGNGVYGTCPVVADVGVAISAAAGSAYVQETQVFTLAINNTGPATVNGVSVTSELPLSVDFVPEASSLACSSFKTGVATFVTCPAGNLIAGANATLLVAVRPTQVGTIDITSQLANASPDVTDTNPGNDSASLSTPVLASADLTISLSDSPDPVLLGQSVAYTVTLTNNGPSTATNVVAIGSLPVCQVASLASGQSHICNNAAMPEAVGMLSQNMSVSATEFDPNAANNYAAVDTLVQAPELSEATLTVTRSGTNLLIDDRVQNLGTGRAGTFDIRYYWSSNATYDLTDISLCQRTVTSLDAGSQNPVSGTLSTSCAVPNAATGNYYVIAIVDGGATVVESDEGNNTTAAAFTLSGIDLLPTALTAAKSGTTKVLVSDTVKNQGGSNAGSFTIRYYLSTNTSYEAGADIALATTANGSMPCNRTRKSLNSGASHSANNSTCYKPGGAVNGVDYYVLVVDDAVFDVSEYNETNNTRATVGTIRW